MPIDQRPVMKDTLVATCAEGGTVFISIEPSKPIESIERIVMARSDAVIQAPVIILAAYASSLDPPLRSPPDRAACSPIQQVLLGRWTIDNAIWFPSKSDEGGIC